MAKPVTHDSDADQYWALVRRLERLEQSVVNAPHARVYNSAAQTVATTTPTTLSFNSTRFDSANLSTAANRLVAPVDGLYTIGAMISWAANATGYRYVSLILNTANTIGFDVRTNAGAAINTVIHVDSLCQLGAGDFVQVVVGQASGSNLNVAASNADTTQYGCEFWMAQI